MIAGIEPARAMDGGSVGDILSEAVDARDWLPRLYSRAEELAFADQMIAAGWVHVIRDDRRVLGFLALDRTELHCLYIRAGFQGQGLGTALMDRAKAQSDRLLLWSYAADQAAQRFYTLHGFRQVGEGHGNDAGLPELRFEWTKDG